MWKGVVALVATCTAGGVYVGSRVRDTLAAQEKGDSNGSLKRRFSKFATVGSQSHMTLDDFVLSCCSSAVAERSESKSLVISPAVRQLFAQVDANGDGMLSFSEYCVLFTFLSTTDEMFKTAFHMFDRDENGSLDFSEFKVAMKALSVDPTASLDLEGSGLVKGMFGEKLDKALSLKHFLGVIQKLRWDVRSVEFEQFQVPEKAPRARDGSPTGRVPLDDVRVMVGTAPADKKEGEEAVTSNQRLVSWQTYTKLFDVIRESDTIERALAIVADGKRASCEASGGDTDGGEAGANKLEFSRALRAANLKLTADDIDTFFQLFDADGSRTIDAAEFGAVCRLRNSFYAAYVPRYDEPKRNPVQHFVACMQQRT